MNEIDGALLDEMRAERAERAAGVAAQLADDVRAVLAAERDQEAVRAAWRLRWHCRRDPGVRRLAARAGVPLVRPDAGPQVRAREARALARVLAESARRVLRDGGSGRDRMVVDELVMAARAIIPTGVKE